MSLFETEKDKTQNQKGVKGNFFLKGIIFMLDENNFEVHQEDFFYAGLESNGQFISQSDMDITLEYELPELDWGFKPEVGRYYSVLYEFSVNYTSDYWGEHDMDINNINLNFSAFDDKANKAMESDNITLE